MRRFKRTDNSKILLNNLVWVSIDVINLLGIEGLNNISFSLQRANQMGENAFIKDENQLFEFFVLTKLDLIPVKSDFIDRWKKALSLYSIDLNPNNISFYQNLLIKCLQSNSPYIRFLAANTIHDGDERFGLGKNFYQELQKDNPLMADAVYIFYYQPNLDTLNFVYSDLLSMASVLEKLSLQLYRKQVKEDCRILRQKFLAEIKQREQLFNEAKQQLLTKKASIESTFKDLQQTEELNKFEKKDILISDFKVPDLPDLSIENHAQEYETIFHEYNIRLDNIDKKLLTLKQALSTRNNIEITLNECKSFDSEIYNQYFANLKLPKIPDFNPDLDRDEYFIDNFSIYEQKLTFSIKKIFNEFISEFKSELDLLETNLDSYDREVKNLSKLIEEGIKIEVSIHPLVSLVYLVFSIGFIPIFLVLILDFYANGSLVSTFGFETLIAIFIASIIMGFIILGILGEDNKIVNFFFTTFLNMTQKSLEYVYNLLSKALFTSKWKKQKQKSYKQYKKNKLKLENMKNFQQKLEKIVIFNQ